MAETSLINIRVILLILLTLLFAAAWASDRPTPPQTAEPERESVPDEPLDTRRQGGNRRPSRPDAFAARPPLTEPVTATAAESSSLWTGLRLPADLAPGEYRVVSDSGQTGALTVKPEDLDASTTWSIRDLYHVRNREKNWYFIRVRHPIPDAFPAGFVDAAVEAPIPSPRATKLDLTVIATNLLDNLQSRYRLSCFYCRGYCDRCGRRAAALRGAWQSALLQTVQRLGDAAREIDWESRLSGPTRDRL